jgi:hypothetical protein
MLLASSSRTDSYVPTWTTNETPRSRLRAFPPSEGETADLIENARSAVAGCISSRGTAGKAATRRACLETLKSTLTIDFDERVDDPDVRVLLYGPKPLLQHIFVLKEHAPDVLEELLRDVRAAIVSCR